MSPQKPVDPRVRLAITQWPPDAPRGSVSTFCSEHEISRNTFYKILNRAKTEGPAAALEPRSRRPNTSPTRLSEELKTQAIHVRSALELSGLDHGPISVHDKLHSLGLDSPSIASLARVFREAGVARYEPRKKPRAAYRRFVFPVPNACWQLDGTEYVLTRGRKCVIFQLIDDHSRLAVASLAATGETSEAAIEVVQRGIARHGVPQKLLTDNGAALNPSRRGQNGQLVAFVSSLGITPITGKPYSPTTQGKNERFHQTLMRWLDKQPLVDTLDELQGQLDEFDRIYNEQRPHQGLPGRVTPQQAWDATAKAEPPKPDALSAAGHARSTGATGENRRRVSRNGQAAVMGVMFFIGKHRSDTEVHAIWDATDVEFFAPNGDFLVRYPRPTRGTRWMAKKHALEIGDQFYDVSPMS